MEYNNGAFLLLSEGESETWAAHAVDDDIRDRGASGGFVTAFLLELLQKGEITGAVLVRRNADAPLEAEAFIARSSSEIVEAAASKYCPVSYDKLFARLRVLKPDDERLAVVGLPCHIAGLSRAESVYPRLTKMTALRIGIVCGGISSRLAYDYILKKLGIDSQNVTAFSNRGGGWPGYMSFHLKSGEVVRIPYQHWLSMGTVLSSPLCRPAACLLCRDPLGFQADISVSDAWLPRYSENKRGVSLVLAKTEVGKRMLHNCQHSLRHEPCTFADFVNANRRVFISKIRHAEYGIKWFVASNCRSRYVPTSVSDVDYTLWTKIILWSYYQHLRIIWKWLPSAHFNMMCRPLLVYLKILTYLKNR
ncbi:MAG: Coenzyme F420 hydrogenase/dehydrogenase, beta subunit C-terminal domain [Thermodesulfobacteriota bacterium]|nr:Coenzyme F420 hydrogenase/dehydrogenase, beta subunit C-terminal domain [Thermodesulfobacteriota bacterium]